jgi:hypothetical protein
VILAQIVGNRVARLCGLFLNAGDDFLKKLWRKQICHTILLVICYLLVTHHPPSGFVFVITF